MSQKKTKNTKNTIIAENRKAKYNYFIENKIECGVVLLGSEVKSLRSGSSNISESYASIEESELWLINSFFPKFDKARSFGHDERRKRKLLASKKEISRLWHNVGRDGMTLVPLKLYFNENGKVKIILGIAKGKKLTDKREAEKRRDWKKQKSRLLKQDF
tara:strand:+ start:31 stop:510 length:480 start_codon:yes stop_codon:yes gene_type:complete